MTIRLFACFLLLQLALPVAAQPLDLALGQRDAIGKYAEVLAEGDSKLSVDAAQEAYRQGKFSPAQSAYLTYGIGARPHWLRFDLRNTSSGELERWLSIETSWLDHIDVYLLQDDRTVLHEQMGDAYPFSERPVGNRFFVLKHNYPPGKTVLYLRVATGDPMVIPAYLTDREAMYQRGLRENLNFGLVYGVILALLLYNLVLFLGIRNSRYLYYSVYLAFFLLMNFAYTGHAYQLLWPDNPTLQRWGNPVLMIAYAISGLLFAFHFLDTRKYFPRWYRFTWILCGLFVLAEIWAIKVEAHAMALQVAFSFVMPYAAGMILFGAMALHAGNKSAKYFLYASIVAAVGAAVTGLTVWGIMPYNPYYYRAVEFGTMIEAVLLALALADLFRRSQEERLQAEKLARIDPLTGLNNRRAFTEQAGSLWRLGVRRDHLMSVLLLDMDGFKAINDTFGHDTGDRVLVQAAETIASAARAEDVLARWGGEEFILFMPETGVNQAVNVAERIRQRIEAMRFEIGGTATSVTASIGVSQYGPDTASLDSLISLADKKLYQAKRTGRNRVYSVLSA